MIMKLFNSLPTAILFATAALLSAGAQAGPMPTNAAAMKSMVDKSTTEVRWRGGGVGYRGVGYRGVGYRGVGYRGVGYRGGLGYRGVGYGVAAGAIVGGAIARSAYYGGDGGYYCYGGDPSYGSAVEPHYGYGVGDVGYSGGCTCSPSGGYVAVHQYGW
jgi:hypothetical protein